MLLVDNTKTKAYSNQYEKNLQLLLKKFKSSVPATISNQLQNLNDLSLYFER